MCTITGRSRGRHGEVFALQAKSATSRRRFSGPERRLWGSQTLLREVFCENGIQDTGTTGATKGVSPYALLATNRDPPARNRDRRKTRRLPCADGCPSDG